MSAYQSDDYDEEDVILFERHIVIWLIIRENIKQKKNHFLAIFCDFLFTSLFFISF